MITSRDASAVKFSEHRLMLGYDEHEVDEWIDEKVVPTLASYECLLVACRARLSDDEFNSALKVAADLVENLTLQQEEKE